MKNFLQWLKLARPFFVLGISLFRSVDANTDGWDDSFADFLEFVLKGIDAMLTNDPDALKNASAEFAGKTLGLPIHEPKL